MDRAKGAKLCASNQVLRQALSTLWHFPRPQRTGFSRFFACRDSWAGALTIFCIFPDSLVEAFRASSHFPRSSGRRFSHFPRCSGRRFHAFRTSQIEEQTLSTLFALPETPVYRLFTLPQIFGQALFTLFTLSKGPCKTLSLFRLSRTFPEPWALGRRASHLQTFASPFSLRATFWLPGSMTSRHF